MYVNCKYKIAVTLYVLDTWFVSRIQYINTFIPIHCLHTAMNVEGRNFLYNKELGNSTVFEPHNLTAFHFDWH